MASCAVTVAKLEAIIFSGSVTANPILLVPKSMAKILPIIRLQRK
jgi:hypothetical protein